MRMHFSKLASFHSKKFYHNALVPYGQIHHLDTMFKPHYNVTCTYYSPR